MSSFPSDESSTVADAPFPAVPDDLVRLYEQGTQLFPVLTKNQLRIAVTSGAIPTWKRGRLTLASRRDLATLAARQYRPATIHAHGAA